MNVSRIRGFLLQLPKPAAVRLTSDGEPQTIKPGRSYAKCAETIAALGAELIECLDGDGNIIRALRMTSADAHRSEAAPIPDGIKADPHALMLTHFANLLHRAYEHSSEVAFTKLVELVDKLGERSESIEQRLERAEAAHRRAVEQQLDDAFERANEVAKGAEAGGGDLLQQMASAFMSGQMHQQPASSKMNGSNGKG